MSGYDHRGDLAFVLSLDITIPIGNSPPTAHAGDDQSVDENTLVFLFGGSSSDPDDDDLAYSWFQVSGLPVQLSNADTATASFITPIVEADMDTVFSLTVSDGLLTDQDSVTVVVLDFVEGADAGPTAVGPSGPGR